MALVVRPVHWKAPRPGSIRSLRGPQAQGVPAGGRGRPSRDGPRAEPAVRRHRCRARCRQQAPVWNRAGGATGRGPACGPLPCPPCPKAVAGTATMAAGACAPGVASSHDVTGHVFGVGIEPTTDGLRIRCSTRLSYPVGDRAESNRVPANRCLQPAGSPGDGMSATSGIRHGTAARTSPCLKRDRWKIEGAGHRHYRRAIMLWCDADNVQALPFARRKCFGTAGIPGSDGGGVPRGVQSWHRGSLCRRKRKRPRDLRSEGVVRPRRSGWPISAGRVSGRCQLVFLAKRARRHIHAQAWQQFGGGDEMRIQGKFPVVVGTRCAR